MTPYAPVILASASPRRAALLEQVGIPFEVIPSGVSEEYPDDLSPQQGALYVARNKALSVAERLSEPGEHVAVLAADTIVVLDNWVLGKPHHGIEAQEMLRRLSGRTHLVVTGVALVWLHRDADASDRLETWAEVSSVTFRALHLAEIEAYVRSGRPLDKAGAYGIQEDAAAFVAQIEGCYFNVVGLPLARLSERLLRDRLQRRDSA
jgi:septum formation protein